MPQPPSQSPTRRAQRGWTDDAAASLLAAAQAARASLAEGVASGSLSPPSPPAVPPPPPNPLPELPIIARAQAPTPKPSRAATADFLASSSRPPSECQSPKSPSKSARPAPLDSSPKASGSQSTVPQEVKNRGATITVQPGVSGAAELLWGLIIRPPRSTYKAAQLGPTHFRIGRHTYVRRTDTELKNPRGHTVRGSFFEPMPQAAWEASRRAAQAAALEQRSRESGEGEDAGAATGEDRRQTDNAPEGSGAAGVAPATAPDDLASGTASSSAAPPPLLPDLEPLPCIVFLHGNSSCRLEALSLLPLLMPLCISLFCFDFSGCGLSDGEYVSLGWFERDDLALSIDYLRSLGRVSRIGLWGRSMGAFTALLHADRDPSIAGLVLDSPFTSLSTLAEELAHSYAKVPAWMVRGVLVLVRSVIQSKAGFDILNLEALDHVERSFSPAFFIAASGDDFILPHHAQELHDAWPGETELTMVRGDHNSVRPDSCSRKAVLFLCRAFHDPRLQKLLDMHASGLYDIFAGPPTFPTPADRSGGTGVAADSRGVAEGVEEAALCRQMRLFPALRMMRLLHGRRCRRPLQARTLIKLQQDHSEAGFFLRLEPLKKYAGLAADNGDETTTRGCSGKSSVTRYFVLTVSSQALIVSRICDDALETVAAADGPACRGACQLMVEVTMEGALRLQLADDPPLEVSCGGPLREEVTLWIMLLRGLTQFGPLTVEDGEATLRERLGATLLESRHLGPPVGVARGVGACSPAPLPVGDLSTTPDPPDGIVAADATAAVVSPLLSEADHDRARAMIDCVVRPEALIGWRVNVHGTGEGIIIGVKRRWGRSTLHVVSCTRHADPPAKCRRQDDTAGAGGIVVESTEVVMLCRKDSHRRRRRGRTFELLNKEF